jgi:hypothetical protein
VKRLALSLVASAAAAAQAQPLALSARTNAVDDPDGIDAVDLTRLTLRDSVVVTHAGATAAFSVDPAIVEVSAKAGQVTILARGVGTTTISIVTARDIVPLTLTVVAPAPWLPTGTVAAPSRTYAVLQSDYESSSARLTTSVEVADGNSRRTLRAYAVNVTRLDDSGADDFDARTSMPAMAVEWKSRDREVVLLDKWIDHSQLTLDGTTVRGGHLRLGGLELHAGVTSPVLYQNVFLSRQAETVLGASYELGLGRSSLTPSVYAYPSPPQTGGTDGAMGSLLYRYHSRDDRLQLRSELGWGGVFGAAGELSYQDPINRAWISARHQPRGFAALGIGRPLGSMLDAMYTGQPSPRLTVGASLNAARYQTAMTEQDVATAMIENRIKVAGPLSVSASISSGQFSGVGMTESVRSITVPLGLHLDGTRAGLSALYRYQTNSARNLGGHGGRLSGRVNGGAFRASAFVDVQQEAATVALVLREEPVLAQLLEELGLTAASSDDLARLLRENATLAQLGYTSGAQLDFNPWRAQAGADAAWISKAKTREQLRLRVLASQTQTVTSLKETVNASLAYSRRLGTGVDATAMVSWWSHDGATAQPDVWSVAAGLRVRLERTPRHARPSRPTVDARAVTTGRLIGTVRDDAGTPMAHIAFELIGRGARQTVTSDSSGRFRVDAAPGDYALSALTDSVPAGYDPSSVGGASVHLEPNAPSTTELVIRAERSVAGTVHARVSASRLRIVELDREGTLDSSGRFVFRGLPPGTFTIEVVVDGSIETRTVVVPAGPVSIRAVDVVP